MTQSTKTIAIPLAIIALIIGAVAMGISPIFVREAEVGPFVSAFWRVALAIPVLAIWSWFEPGQKDQKRQQNWSLPIILGGVFFAGDLIFWHLSITNTSVANAALFACLAPVWVSLFSNLTLGEAVDRKTRIGLIICLCGAALLLSNSFVVRPENLLGDFFGIITSIFFGLYFLAIRAAQRSASSGRITLNTTLITAVILFCFALLMENQFLPQTAKGYGSLLALGIFSHAGGQGLLTVALGVLSAIFSSLVIFIEAVAAAIAGWLIYGENLTGTQFIGAILIVSGVWVARPSGNSSKSAERAIK